MCIRDSSSPVIGNSHKGETLYAWGECCDWVWKGFGDKETHSVYKGQVKDGKPEGIGILIYKDGRKYEGNWKMGFGMEEGNTLSMMDLDMKVNGKMVLKTEWEF